MKEKQESPRRRCLLILIEKIPNAMKLTFLFLVISLLSFTATASAQRVSIVLDNAKVEKVLATITHQTGLSVAYSKQIVDLNRRVSVNFTNAELTNVLDKITEGKNKGCCCRFKRGTYHWSECCGERYYKWYNNRL